MADVELEDALPQVGGARTITLDITTGAAPVDVPLQDPSVWRVIVNVTSGGTAGDETINLTIPAVDDNGGNRQYTGQHVLIQLVNQTDPGDVVVVTADGNGTFDIANPQRGFAQYPKLTRVALDYENANVDFAWLYYWWYCSPGSTDLNFSAIAGSQDQYFQPALARPTDADGSAAVFKGGNGNGAGAGGDAVIEGGNGATVGNVKMPSLPTADPLVAGALWNSSGNVKISAGA